MEEENIDTGEMMETLTSYEEENVGVGDINVDDAGRDNEPKSGAPNKDNITPFNLSSIRMRNQKMSTIIKWTGRTTEGGVERKDWC